jgi:hypothetical protein
MKEGSCANTELAFILLHVNAVGHPPPSKHAFVQSFL